MRVLITGISGFVGSTLAPALREFGHEVRGASGRGDVTELLVGCEAIVHLANIAHGSVSPDMLYRVNVEGTRFLAEKAVAGGARRLVYLSSIKAVGEETRGFALHGTEVPAPEDVYGRAKLAAERALAEVAGRTGLEVLILRPPLVYGPGVKANLLTLMRAVDRGWLLPFASIENRRSLIYVGNLCDAIIRCLEAPQAAGRTYLVSDGLPVSTPQLCRALGDALGRPARLFPFPARLLELYPGLRRLTRSLEVDDSAIRSELGWRPPYTFEEGLRATAEWYRTRGG